MIFNEENTSIIINEIEIPLIGDKDKENVFFKAKLICDALKYIKFHQALETNLNDLNNLEELVDYEYIKKNYQIEILPDKEHPKTKYLTEYGLYEFLMRSSKPGAKEFRESIKKILKTLRKDKVYILNQEKDELKKQLQIKTAECIKNLDDKNKILNEKNKILNKFNNYKNKFNQIKQNLITTTTYNKMPTLTICELKRTDPTRPYQFNYYVIRCQRKTMSKAIKNIKDIYDIVDVLKTWDDPNAITIFNHIKENNNIGMVCYQNTIRFEGNYNHDNLIRYVEQLKNQNEISLESDESDDESDDDDESDESDEFDY